MELLKEFMGRTPFAIMGALGIFGFAADVTQIDENMQVLVNAWRDVARPVADFLFGWNYRLFEMEMPSWVKDYLAAGLIVSGMSMRGFRAMFRDATGLGALVMLPSAQVVLIVPFTLLGLLIWPLYLVLFSYMGRKVMIDIQHHIERQKLDGAPPNRIAVSERELKGMRDFLFAFYETFVYALILLALNYWLLIDL